MFIVRIFDEKDKKIKNKINDFIGIIDKKSFLKIYIRIK